MSAPSQQPAMQATHWPAVLIAIFAGAAGAFCLGKVPAVLGLLRQELGLSLVEGGWIASAFNSLAIVLSLFMGLLLMRWNALQAGIIGLLLLLLGGAVALPAHGLTMMLSSRVIEGIGFLLVSVAMPGMIISLACNKDKHLALSLWAVNLPLGAAIGMLLTPALATMGGWRLAWLAGMVLQLLALLLLLACKPVFRQRNAQTLASTPPPAAPFAVLRQSAVWRYGLAFMLYTLMLWAVFVWLPTMLQARPDLNASHIALLSALAVVANIPGNLAGAWLLKRGMARDTLICCALGLMGFSGVLAYWPGLPADAAYLLCLLLAFCGGAVPPAALSSAHGLSQSPVQLAVLQGYFVQLANLGQLLGPLLLAALVAGSTDWSVARPLFLAGVVLAAVLFAIRPRSH
ncbi:CynX/NimT family MFS transporter [Aquitalea sp. LB_tupeE]|uniref:MFS transporter n=1 Tax=Aquitalea sp. LB_tupeE TaxID=2748078 RepID=UPI0015C16CDC|nr:MFS transporter [Aquitalea sp. LB_tupeE]NWK79785.1 MFS transporter [Aquitalea sp. LB_tupeE]